MGSVRRADRGDVLSGALWRGSGDATLLFHDRHRAGRRHARPAGADHPHADCSRALGARNGAAIGGASEFSDVVFGEGKTIKYVYLSTRYINRRPAAYAGVSP